MVVRRERTLSGTPSDLWRIVSDPARLPAWWPGVSRVEEASREAWTTVLISPKGKSVRADYSLVEADEPGLLGGSRRWRSLPSSACWPSP